MSATEYAPRLSIRISEKLAADLNASIAWGLKNALFTRLAEDVVRLVREHGAEALYLYLRGDLELTISTKEPKHGPK